MSDSGIESAARLASLRASTAAMVAGFQAETWTDADMLAPSTLPGWTRGHVLTHIARNADGMAAAMSGALRGELVRRYPHGPAGRDADIAAGAPRPVTQQLADVRDSAARLDLVLGAVADVDGWDLVADDRTVLGGLLARWREVEIHRVDTAGSYQPRHWPAEFVGYLLPVLADRLGELTDQAVRIEITPDASCAVHLVGRSWTAGSGEPTLVAGPDWAVLGWLAGRPGLVDSALTAAPALGTAL